MYKSEAQITTVKSSSVFHSAKQKEPQYYKGTGEGQQSQNLKFLSVYFSESYSLDRKITFLLLYCDYIRLPIYL